MAGTEQGEIAKLLVLEQLPKPVNFSGGSEPLTVGGTFTLQRVLGTVPVEPDGSAYFEVPALRSLFFVALDENEMSVKRMQSFVTVQPGETTSCVGCHEQRTRAPHPRDVSLLQAMQRPPSRIEPYANLPDVFDFPRDIQPILDRHCLACHNDNRCEGNINLSGDRTPWYTTAYWTMFSKSLVVDGRNKHGNLPPRAIGSSASRLMDCLDPSHHGVELSGSERNAIRCWIDSGATYSGTYACLGSGMFPVDFPEQIVIGRCAACHKATKESYRNVKQDAFYFQFGDQEPPQPLLKKIDDIILIRHLAYFQLGEAPLYQALCNLDRPADSLFLRAPLAAAAGGLQRCGQPVFKDKEDPDYLVILDRIEAASRRLREEKRFDMAGFRPNRYYIREMQRLGILPGDLPTDAAVDPYATDRAYWRTFQFAPRTR
jgi:mono/diheme cytochrome c family protein